MATHSGILAWTEDRGAWRATAHVITKSRTRLSDLAHTQRNLTSLVAQMVKHLPTMQETRVQSLGQEDLLEKEMATHSSILARKIPRTEKPQSTVHGVIKSRTRLSDFTSHRILEPDL